MEQQKEQIKKDHDEAIKKFDQTLSHLGQLKRIQEQDLQSSLSTKIIQGETVNQIERKHQMTIMEQQDLYQDEISYLKK